jgi:hypothetical protein
VAARDRNILERHVVASIEDRDILAYHARYNRRRGGIWRTRAPWSLLVTGAQQTLVPGAQRMLSTGARRMRLRACGEYSPRPYPHSPSASRDRRIGGLVFMHASISIPYSAQGAAQLRNYYYRAKFLAVHHPVQHWAALRWPSVPGPCQGPFSFLSYARPRSGVSAQNRRGRDSGSGLCTMVAPKAPLTASAPCVGSWGAEDRRDHGCPQPRDPSPAEDAVRLDP